MLKRDIDKLNNKRVFLIKHLELSEKLYQYLRNDKNRILTEDLENEIKRKSSESQVGFFLDVISKRGAHVLETLLNALYHTGQFRVLHELEPRFDAKREATKSLQIDLRGDDLMVNEVMTRIEFHPTFPPNTESLGQETTNQDMEIQEQRNRMIISQNNSSLDINEITDTIKRKIRCYEDSEGDEDEIESSNSKLMGKVFTLKTISNFIDGHDFLFLNHLDRKLGNHTSCFNNLVKETSELTKNLEKISEIVNRFCMTCPMILLDAECEGGLILFKKGCKLSCSEVVLQIIDLIQSETLVIMLSLYGALNTELHRLIDSGNSKFNSKNLKLIFISHFEKHGDDNHWMLCAMDECFMRICNSTSWNMEDVFSLVTEVGKRSVESNIISGFHSMKLPNS